jgi:hypothetical protein
VVGPGEAVPDAVLAAHPAEDVAAEDGLDLRVAAAVLGQLREGHAVVGQHGVDAVGEGLDHLAQEGGAVPLGVGVEEGDVGELRAPVDGEEQEELALGQAQLADVDVDVADRGLGEASAFRGLLFAPGQARDAAADQATVQGAAGELGDALAQAAEHVIERQQGAAPELDHDGLLDLAQHGAARPGWPHRGVGDGRPPAPLGDGLGVQPVAGGQAAGRLLRPLELGSNSRRRAGRAVKTVTAA